MKETQWKLLAEAIPALSYAVGRNWVAAFGQDATGEERNYDMQTLRNDDNNAWPPDRPNTRWLHTDVRAVAYPYIYKRFDTFVELGGLR